MNKQEYLLNRKKKNSAPTPPQRIICPKCLRPPVCCFCQYIVPFKTESEFRILMHPMEYRKERVGTGRMTHLCMQQSKIIVDVNFSHNDEIKKLMQDENYFPILLYPGEEAHNISKAPLPFAELKNRRPVFLVIDGTWPCAKTMMRESYILHSLPRVSFDVRGTSRFSIKHQPVSMCLSTIESVYELLDCLNRWGHENLGQQHQILLEMLDRLVKFQIECAADPSKKSYKTARRKGYKDPSERKAAKKWQDRKICFENKNYINNPIKSRIEKES